MIARLALPRVAPSVVATLDDQRPLGRWYRPLAFGSTVALLAAAAFLVALFWPPNAIHTGEDLVHYLDGVRRWFATGSPYLPNEVAGPFTYEVETFLQTPVTLIFLVPWLVIPAILWWAIPIGIVIGLVAYWRPAPWTWPLIAFGLTQPQLHQALLWGNTNLWLTAAVAVGLVIGWPAALVLTKPSLLPFALIGIHRRSWWTTTAILITVSIPFGYLWIEWINVVLNSPADPTYGLRNLPWIAIPVFAWAGRRGALLGEKESPR